MKNIPFVSIEAKNNYELGFGIGRKLKTNIKKRLATCKTLYKKMGVPDFSVLSTKAMNFLPATTKYLPEYVIEAEAMAKGAGVDFEELMVLICEEELIDLKIPKCTSIALKTQDAVLIGHNEDWLTSYKNNGLYLLKAKMGGKRTLSLNYMGTLPGSSSGLNSDGLAFTANSLNAGRFRYGVPIKFQFRAILDCKSPRQAIRSDLKNSSISGNTIYAWKKSRITDVEDYFGHHEIFYNDKFLIHTNHPILSRDRNDENTEKESIRRYERSKQILSEAKTINLNTLKKLLSDHKANICAHPPKNRFWGTTIASVIINPKEKWMEVCWSNPCKNKYHRYYL
jgi:isopenicillin-N N-acyltransferase like protein